MKKLLWLVVGGILCFMVCCNALYFKILNDDEFYKNFIKVIR